MYFPNFTTVVPTSQCNFKIHQNYFRTSFKSPCRSDPGIYLRKTSPTLIACCQSAVKIWIVAVGISVVHNDRKSSVLWQRNLKVKFVCTYSKDLWWNILSDLEKFVARTLHKSKRISIVRTVFQTILKKGIENIGNRKIYCFSLNVS